MRRPNLFVTLVPVLLLVAACNFRRFTSMAVGGDGLGLISYRDGETGVLKAGHCEDAAKGPGAVGSLLCNLGAALSGLIGGGAGGIVNAM